MRDSQPEGISGKSHNPIRWREVPPLLQRSLRTPAFTIKKAQEQDADKSERDGAGFRNGSRRVRLGPEFGSILKTHGRDVRECKAGGDGAQREHGAVLDEGPAGKTSVILAAIIRGGGQSSANSTGSFVRIVR